MCKIHRTLQAGSILVFVTGQREVHHLCSKLRERFPTRSRREKGRGEGVGARTLSVCACEESEVEGVLEVFEGESDGEELEVKFGREEWEKEEMLAADSQLPMRVLPLYSLLSPAQQAKVTMS